MPDINQQTVDTILSLLSGIKDLEAGVARIRYGDLSIEFGAPAAEVVELAEAAPSGPPRTQADLLRKLNVKFPGSV